MKTIDPRDDFLIINTETKKGVESWGTAVKAQHACEVLNDHELRNGRKPVYQIVSNRTQS